MLYRLLLIPLFALLGACQSTPELDYDTTRDFAGYRTWSWQDPAVRYHPGNSPLQSDLTEQRIRDAVAQQLEQRGLRQASGAAQADLRVQAWFSVERRQDSYTTYYGGMFAGYPGSWWGGPSYAQTQTYDYRVGILQVDLFDGRDGRLVWRASDEQMVPRRQTPGDRATLIRETAARVLSQYPPRAR